MDSESDKGKIFWNILQRNVAKEQNLLLTSDWCQLGIDIQSVLLDSTGKTHVQFSSLANKHVWWLISGNGSVVVSSHRRPCNWNNTPQYSFEPSSRLDFSISLERFPYHYPAYAKETFNTVRFIACGQMKSEPYPFQELATVFNIQIWSLMLITSVLVSI